MTALVLLSDILLLAVIFSIWLSAAKNVVLGGVKSVTLHDSGNVEMSDLSSQVKNPLILPLTFTD